MAVITHEKTSRLVLSILELVRILAAALSGFFGGQLGG